MTQPVRFPYAAFTPPTMPNGTIDSDSLTEMSIYAERLAAIDPDTLIWHGFTYSSADRLRDLIVVLRGLTAEDRAKHRPNIYSLMHAEIKQIGRACVWDGAAEYFVPCIAGEALAVWSALVIRYRGQSEAAHTYRRDRVRLRAEAREALRLAVLDAETNATRRTDRVIRPQSETIAELRRLAAASLMLDKGEPIALKVIEMCEQAAAAALPGSIALYRWAQVVEMCKA